MSVVRLNEFVAAEQQEQTLHDFLDQVASYIRGSDGCISCDVYRDIENPKTIVVWEVWDSKESHQASLAAYPKDKMQEAMVLIAEPPKGKYLVGN